MQDSFQVYKTFLQPTELEWHHHSKLYYMLCLLMFLDGLHGKGFVMLLCKQCA